MPGGEGPLEGSTDLQPFACRLSASWLVTAPKERHRSLDGTLVSADLSGFTAMSERLAAHGRAGAEELTATVNGCFTALIETAAAHGGDVLKFGGDALLIWFDGDDHAARAVYASAQMQQAIGVARFARSGLRMSVGASSGTFDLFLVGRPEARELVLAGPLVTETVNLEAAASAGELVIGEPTAMLLPDGWHLEPAGAGYRVDLEALPPPPAAAPPADLAVAVRSELVPAALRKHLVALAGVGGEHRLATVVFAEIEGTDEAVASDVGAFAAQLDNLVRATQDGCERFGLLFLYTDVIADGVKLIAVAGAPTSSGEDEEAGLRFATELVSGDPLQNLRAGVNRGRVFAGFLGSTRRRTYTVMGDPVNLAARLMAKAEAGTVVASDELVQLVRSEFERSALEPFLVKGKTQPIAAHVIGSRRDRGVDASRRQLPIVGRRRELRHLVLAADAANAGTGAVVELVADAGVGKTRLVEALVAGGRLDVALAVECQPYDVLTSYGSLRGALRRLAGIPADAARKEAGRGLLDFVAAVAPGLSPFVPLIAVPFGADVPSTPEADVVAERVRQRRTEEVTVALLEAALLSPCLLVVEDTYYIDEASHSLLRAVARATPGRPWLLCITRRPDTPGVVSADIAGDVLELAPLDGDEPRELLRAATADLAVPDDVLDRLLERAAGNPLFVLSLVEAVRDGSATDELPESIERLVAARIDALEPDDVLLLRHAAVVGRAFDLDILVEVVAPLGFVGVDRAERWESLAEFVHPAGDRSYTFRHALFRDAAYAGLPFRHRKRLHAAVGDQLLRSMEAGATPPPGLLSAHFAEGGRAPQAWEWSLRAGDEAMGSHTVTEAAAAYQRALQVSRAARVPRSEVGRVAELLADAHFRAGRYDEAGAALQRARRAVLEPAMAVARLVRKQGSVHERLGRLGQAGRWFQRAMALVGDDPSDAGRTEAVELRLAMGGIRLRQARTTEGLRWIDEAIASAAAIGYDGAVARGCYITVGLTGSPEEDERRAKQGLEIYERLDDPWGQGQMWNNLGVTAYYAGHWGDSAECQLRARALFLRAGDSVAAAMSSTNRAEILAAQGVLEEAELDCREALRVWTAAGYSIGVAVATMYLGGIALLRGDLDAAGALLGDARDRFATMGVEAYRVESQARLAEVALQRGEHEIADALARDLQGELEDAEAEPRVAVVLLRVRAQCAAARGDEYAARELLGDAFERAEAESLGYEAALCVQQMAATASGDDGDAAAAFAADAAGRLAALGVGSGAVTPLPA